MAERNLTAIIHPRAVRGQIKQPAYTASAGLIVRFLIMKIQVTAISFINRLRATWLVFTGKADALIWPGGQ